MTTEQKLRSYSIGSGHPDAARVIQLERENAALEKRLQEIQRMCLGYQEEHAGLRKDAQRLNFVEANWEARLLRRHKKRWSFAPGVTNYEYPVFPKLREAIDAAMMERT
jgi:hypothetical protein